MNAQDQTQLTRRFYTQQRQYQLSTQQNFADSTGQVERLIAQNQRVKTQKKATIPVVFHILASVGQPVVSEEQVFSQLEALNRDFMSSEFSANRWSIKTDLERDVADTEISFCTPAKNPFGKNTGGIMYHQTDHEVWFGNDKMKASASGGVDAWETSQYLNVWVVNLVDSISGWAQMPGGPSATDGIVIDSRYFGIGGTSLAPYNEGKTLTHLVGNYLGLYDLWNEFDRCADDYVTDTPIHNGPNSACYRDETHVSLCYDNTPEMTMNFMDNTPDECMYMFTIGQKLRMQAALAEGGPRAKLTDTQVKCNRVPSPTSLSDTTAYAFTLLNKEATGSIPQIEITVGLSPNPASEATQLVVTLPTALPVRVVAYDAVGKVVYQQAKELAAGQHQFDLITESWPPGLYYVHTLTGDSQTVEKLIVQ
ncbi:MAG: M43 family zinc metalloprotease [Lewinella sp.]